MSLTSKEFQDALSKFLKAAWACKGFDFSQGLLGLRLHGGRPFSVSDEARQSQAHFVRLAIKKLGPIKGHAKTLDKALWDIVVDIDDISIADDPRFLMSGLKKLAESSYEKYSLIFPCANVKIPQTIDCLRLSDSISINRSELLVETLNKRDERVVFQTHNELKISSPFSSGDEIIHVKIPPLVWVIQVEAASPLKNEQSLWQVDVMLSIMRFVVSEDGLGHLANRRGEVECHPFEYGLIEENCVSLTERAINLGGRSVKNFYELSDTAVMDLTDGLQVSKISSLMLPSGKSLAERFHQGCGWLTRARRANDRSDRILYIFTALESLLSDSDKTSPVIQTISRNAGVICSDNIDVRYNISKNLKDLYLIRSALVRAGKRSANNSDVVEAEAVTEYIFQRVWDNVDLTMRHEKFVSALSRASFGLPFESVIGGNS